MYIFSWFLFITFLNYFLRILCRVERTRQRSWVRLMYYLHDIIHHIIILRIQPEGRSKSTQRPSEAIPSTARDLDMSEGRYSRARWRHFYWVTAFGTYTRCRHLKREATPHSHRNPTLIAVDSNSHITQYTWPTSSTLDDVRSARWAKAQCGGFLRYSSYFIHHT